MAKRGALADAGASLHSTGVLWIIVSIVLGIIGAMLGGFVCLNPIIGDVGVLMGARLGSAKVSTSPEA